MIGRLAQAISVKWARLSKYTSTHSANTVEWIQKDLLASEVICLLRASHTWIKPNTKQKVQHTEQQQQQHSPSFHRQLQKQRCAKTESEGCSRDSDCVQK